MGYLGNRLGALSLTDPSQFIAYGGSSRSESPFWDLLLHGLSHSCVKAILSDLRLDEELDQGENTGFFLNVLVTARFRICAIQRINIGVLLRSLM